MSLITFAENELKLAGLFDEDSDYSGEVGKATLELIEKFSEQGHSGASAPMVIGLFSKLASFIPITPITGKPEEWVEQEGCKQNVKCCSVFKYDDGNSYYIDALIFKPQDGGAFSGNIIDEETGENISSMQKITFPFYPKTFVINITEKQKEPELEGEDEYSYHIQDRKQLEDALKYFSKG